ncbi:hypothetical protein KC19_7G001800 [Ceratodon purpureus]|uniref:Uncharacterized protein n=2 Tax=Ceratodon purpureus TaxID=3225 RepID=A0A8T0H980_CERPU|nr:hypothetical protein KC19_7G001800 [Ceratodon purpureus]
MAEGEDLYDDLFQDVGDMLLPKTPFQSFHTNDTREEEFKKKEAELNCKLELLQKEVEALQQDKAVLTRNISCLFKTAQMELARKDKQMTELRDENLRLKFGGTRGPTNVRPHLHKAIPSDKTIGQGKMTIERNHHNFSIVGAPGGQSLDEVPHSREKRLHSQSYTVMSNDRGASGSNGGQTSQSHLTVTMATSEATVLDPVLKRVVEIGSSEQSTRSRRPGSSESTRDSARIREFDSDVHRLSSDGGKKCRSPSSSGLLNSRNQHRDINSDSSRRAADDSAQKQKVSTNDKDSRSNRPRDERYDDNLRHTDSGLSKYRSPERSWDNIRERSRDRRDVGNLRSSDSRKRHRSLSRERDARPGNLESSRATKTVNKSGSQSVRERQNDHSNRDHR